MAETVEVEIKVDSSDAKKSIGGIKKDVEGIEKETKKVGKGLSTWTKILNSAGILALISAIVAAFVKIKDALMQNAEFAAAFSRVMAGVNAVIGKVVDTVVDFFKNIKDGTSIFTKFGDTIKAAFENPKQALIDIGNIIKKNITNRLEGFQKIAKSLSKIFSKDWKEGLKDFANASAQVVTGVEDPITKVVDGAKKLGKNIKESVIDPLASVAKEAVRIEGEFQKLELAQGRLNVKSAEYQQLINEQRKLAEDTTKTFEERRIATEKAIALEKEITDEQVALKERELELLKQKNSLTSSTIEDINAEKQLEAEVSQLKADSTQRQIELQNKLNSLTKEEQAEMQAEIQANLDAEELLKQTKINNIEDDKKRAIEQAEFNKQLRDKEYEEELALLKELGINEETLFQLKLERDKENEMLYQDELQAIRDEAAEKDKENTQKVEEEKAAIRKESLENFESLSSTVFSTISTLNQASLNRQLAAAEGNEEEQEQIRKKFARKQKTLDTAQAIINGALAVTKATAQTGILAPFAVPTIIASTAAQVALIQSQKFAKGGLVKGPGTGTSDSIPAMLSNGEAVINAKSTKMFRNELSSINKAGGGVAFATGGIAGETGSRSSRLDTINEDIQSALGEMRVTVLESDISGAQNRVKVVENDSTL